jgi:hypothetical protein
MLDVLQACDCGPTSEVYAECKSLLTSTHRGRTDASLRFMELMDAMEQLGDDWGPLAADLLAWGQEKLGNAVLSSAL